MMHGMKKSDEAVLPVKAANKGARATAELPEGRASTKGIREVKAHAGRSAGSVTQATDRIRQAKPTVCRHTPEVGAPCPSGHAGICAPGELAEGRGCKSPETKE